MRRTRRIRDVEIVDAWRVAIHYDEELRSGIVSRDFGRATIEYTRGETAELLEFYVLCGSRHAQRKRDQG